MPEDIYIVVDNPVAVIEVCKGSTTEGSGDIGTQDKIQFNPVLGANPAHSEGLVFYDPDKHALSYYNEYSGITLNIGQEVLFRGLNNTGATIWNGSVVTPGAGTVTLADAYITDKSRLLAMATHDIPNGQFGYFTRLGQVGGLETEEFPVNTLLYLGRDGAFVAEQPTLGGYSNLLGVVNISDGGNGVIAFNPQISTLTVEATDTNGFPPEQRNNTGIAVNAGTLELTVDAAGYPFHFYENGNKFERPAPDTVAFTNTEGEWWFYYQDGVLISEYNPSGAQREHIILNHAFVSSFYWNATDGVVVLDHTDERHGISMSPAVHLNLHKTRGAQYISGFSVGNVNADANGSLDQHAQFSVTSGTYLDEDLEHSSNFFSAGGTYPVIYNLGLNANLREGSQAGFAFLNAPAGRPYYNELDDGQWFLTEVPNNDFVLIHLFSFNGVNKNLTAVMGQAFYANRSAARDGANTEISNILTQLPLAEMIPIATIILECRDVYSNSVNARIRSTDEGDDYVDWRTTALSTGNPANSHLNLTDLKKAASGEAWGHVDNSLPLQLPQLTTAERDLIIPNEGMIIRNTTTAEIEEYAAGAWTALGGAPAGGGGGWTKVGSYTLVGGETSILFDELSGAPLFKVLINGNLFTATTDIEVMPNLQLTSTDYATFRAINYGNPGLLSGYCICGSQSAVGTQINNVEVDVHSTPQGMMMIGTSNAAQVGGGYVHYDNVVINEDTTQAITSLTVRGRNLPSMIPGATITVWEGDV
jgi:hypothetical protein